MIEVLDLDAVRAFIHVADLCSFTRAADALGTTQSAVSLKVKRLEAHIGKRLFERTPRSVRLSAAGHAFLASARDLLDAHQRALASLTAERRTLKIGISEHVVGSQLVRIVENLHRHDSRLILEVHLGSSFPLLAQYDERRLDAVIVRYEADEAPAWTARTDAEPLFAEPLIWLAAGGWRPEPGEPLPLAMIAPPCGVRGVAIRALERANIAWQETFVGGGIAAVGAALAAGLAVSALAKRVAPPGLVEVNGKNGLPALPTLPKSQIVMHSRMRDPRAAAALRILAASIERG